MTAYHPAREEQYESFLDLMRQEAASYLESTMQLMGMPWEEFERLFRTVGSVWGVYQDGTLAGFYWIEERQRVLHLHALVLKVDFQGKGIGSEVLETLARQYSGKMEAIELGVHRSNPRAIALYERAGFQTVKVLEELGFYIMQRSL
jgi:ribosomal protein S18 acetylase RimI-like enzyme